LSAPIPQGRPSTEGSRQAAPLHPDRIRSLRPPKPVVDPWSPLGTTEEEERQPDGSIAAAATLFLAGAECPWTCVFCDLWRYTIAGPTPAGAIPRQIELALAALHRRPRIVKLYNASNFFEPRAVPPEDDEAIAALVRGFSRIVVECHPRLVGARALELARRLAAPRDPARGERGDSTGATLEIALGLESSDPRALPHLGKGATLDDFELAADLARRASIDLRAFLLVGTPYIPVAEQKESIVASARFAIDRLGARHVSLIPVRGGNGALERLAAEGSFAPPDLALLESALDACIELGTRPDAAAPSSSERAVITADLWDLERLASCPTCFAARRERLELTNRSGSVQPVHTCSACGS
jgi:uncharacterized Fe-S cluster-containing MiaB family protein